MPAMSAGASVTLSISVKQFEPRRHWRPLVAVLAYAWVVLKADYHDAISHQSGRSAGDHGFLLRTRAGIRHRSDLRCRALSLTPMDFVRGEQLRQTERGASRADQP